jgi:hypothetical protein
MNEINENQLKRVLAEMVANGEIKTQEIDGVTHYSLSDDVDASASVPPPQLQQLIDDKEVIKIFRDGDEGFSLKYSSPVDLAGFKASISETESRREELIRKFKALL